MFIDKLFKKDPSLKRHIAKTITWRLVGSLDTLLLGWFFSGSIAVGASISAAEFATKMILYFLHERAWYNINLGVKKQRKAAGTQNAEEAQKNVVRQELKVSTENHEALKNQKGQVIWFTGLSGSGKSTLANALEQKLYEQGVHTFLLDGDNTRLGINKDLDFTDAGREENIRRVAEIAKLMADAGLVVITAFISPFKADRAKAKSIIGESRFAEVFVDTPLEECIKRDVKGLYKKALAGEIKNFTGISSPYEKPEGEGSIVVSTVDSSIETIAEELFVRFELKV